MTASVAIVIPIKTVPEIPITSAASGLGGHVAPAASGTAAVSIPVQ